MVVFSYAKNCALFSFFSSGSAEVDSVEYYELRDGAGSKSRNLNMPSSIEKAWYLEHIHMKLPSKEQAMKKRLFVCLLTYLLP